MTNLEKFIFNLLPKTPGEVEASDLPFTDSFLWNLRVSLNNRGIDLGKIANSTPSDSNLKVLVRYAIDETLRIFSENLLDTVSLDEDFDEFELSEKDNNSDPKVIPFPGNKNWKS